MPMVSSHIPQNTIDCCFQSLWKRGRRCQARARIPKSATGSSQTICPPSGSLKRRKGPRPPVSKSPPGPPAGCCRPPAFLPRLVDPPFPFVGGVPGVDEVPFPPVLPERVVPFVGVFARGPPPNPL